MEGRPIAGLLFNLCGLLGVFRTLARTLVLQLCGPIAVFRVSARTLDLELCGLLAGFQDTGRTRGLGLCGLFAGFRGTGRTLSSNQYKTKRPPVYNERAQTVRIRENKARLPKNYAHERKKWAGPKITFMNEKNGQKPMQIRIEQGPAALKLRA